MNHRLDSALKQRLVKAAVKIADIAARQRNQTSQLRNLIQIAQVESEVPVLRNFLEYQAGRKATKRFWRPIHQDVADVLESIPDDVSDEHQQRLAILSFFGYMVRRYVYATEVKKKEKKPDGGHGARDRQRQGGSQR